MAELTESQRREIQRGGVELVRFIDPVTHKEYVLIPAEVYDRMRLVVDGAAKRAGWDDPSLDDYEQYRKPV